MSDAARLVSGIREILADAEGSPCSFFACPGADHPAVGMATCNVCFPQIALKELIGEPPAPCFDLSCYLCRGEDPPWCERHEDQRVTECPPTCPDRLAAEAAVKPARV